METKPNSFLVGIVVLMILVAGSIFVIWLSRLEIGISHNLYRIEFDGSVTGLRENEDVLYKGIAIGKVKKIRVFRDDVDRIKVIVDISRPDIIRESSVATIEARGITGYTFIQIQGSESSSPILEPKEGQKYPTIKSEKSSIETLFTKGPKLIENLTNVAEQLKAFFSDDFIKDTHGTIENLRSISKDLSNGTNSLDTILSEFRKSMAGFTSATSRFEVILNENQPALSTFMQAGLPAITQMSQKIDGAADQLSDLLKMIQRSPRDLLLKTPNKGYKIK